MAEKPKTTTKKPAGTPLVPLDRFDLLDEFAMAALTGAVANKDVGHITIRQAQLLAESCYEIAEAMVAEREKHGK